MMHPHMSAYNEVFLNALCDNYSHITSKIFTGCHIMQLLLVNAMFERIFPTPRCKIYSLLCFNFFFSLCWVIFCECPFIAHSLLCRTPCPVPLHPGSSHSQAGFQLQFCFPCHPCFLCHPSFSLTSILTLPSLLPPCHPSFPPFPLVFPKAAVLACSV